MTGGSAQRFCSTGHRQQFWIAARRWTMRAIEVGLLSVDCLKASHTSVHAVQESLLTAVTHNLKVVRALGGHHRRSRRWWAGRGMGRVDVLVANEGKVGATRHLTVRSRPPLRPRAATNIADRVGAAGHALNALTRPVEPLATTRCSVCRGNERGRARPFVRRWPKVAGARLPPSPPLIYLLSNEVLLPERAACRDRFVAG
jgi:hypothetical protein